MILLAATTDKLQVVTSAASNIDLHVSYADYSATFTMAGLGRQNTNVQTATTTDILAAPSGTNVRNVKQITCRNKGTLPCDCTIQYNANATLYELHKQTLQPGDLLEFVEGVGFFVVTNITASRLVTNVETGSQRIFRSMLAARPVATAGTEDLLNVSGTAYCVYIGRVAQAITVAFVEFLITVVGAGTNTGEVGLFSSPGPPNKTAQTLTKIAATGTINVMTALGVCRNTSSLAQVVPAGTFLWAVCRLAPTTTQPRMAGLYADFGQGHIQTLAGASALTGITTLASTILATAATTLAVCPDLRVTMD